MRCSAVLDPPSAPPPTSRRWINRGAAGRRALLCLVLAIAIVATGGCVRRTTEHLEPSLAATGTETTALGLEVMARSAAHPGLSGVHLLGNPRRAFATLVGLADAAERSLDLQYYIWHLDTTGWLLIDAVWRAAERGVRVRLLLDDFHTAGTDWVLAALDAHPAIEVRLFNPFPTRHLRFLDAVRDFVGTNRRMHNKSFTADNQVTVMGGRNIGDAYHSEGATVTFADLDVAAVGPIVAEVSAQFDRFWNSPFAVPAAEIIRPQAPPPDDYLATRTEVRLADADAVAYVDSLDPWLRAFPLDALPLEWGRAVLLYDAPEKIENGGGTTTDLMIPALMAAMGVPQQRLDIVTPYFVISKAWSDVFASWTARGVEMRILTNSLAANDPAIAHAGYMVRRRGLLLAGVQLYELKAGATDPEIGDRRAEAPGYRFADSSATLHAKTAAIDGKRLFVGSLNLDQRSAYLNTEMGMVIESPPLAEDLHRMFDERLLAHAYRVTVGADSRLRWIERTPDGDVVYDSEPEIGVLGWLSTGIVALLPLDWLL